MTFSSILRTLTGQAWPSSKASLRCVEVHPGLVRSVAAGAQLASRRPRGAIITVPCRAERGYGERERR